ncbi:alanyl-tRNA editing protein [Halomicrococcus sp. SG-WS-1]|uniref:alanyl-tRNA editing protein n=1 Tax=Halomicrococcus sp. SG-WS-1 TaxID=3439057 RepID=UPI003F7A5F4C
MSTDAKNNLSAVEPYVTEFEATVESIDGRAIALEQTYFYPEGGGQPADRGTLNGAEVTDVQKQEGETRHVLGTEPELGVGDTVTARIDDEFRTYCMRAHTASHLVYGAGRQLFDDHGYGGFDIGPEKTRLDFETDRDPNDVDPLTVERMVNEVVWDGRAVDWRDVDVDRARERDDVVFNLSDDTEWSDTVRIVEIDDWDIAACGGTHVRNTSEIGPITVLDVSNPGADLLRIEYTVGPAAVQRQIDTRRNAERASDVLDTSVDDLPERATSLVQENSSLEEQVDRLHERLLEGRLESLVEDSVSKNGEDWVVGEVESVGPNDVADHVRRLAGDAGDVVALTGVDGSSFIVVGTTGSTDASDVVDDVTSKFGGGGGGGSTFAQGGGLDDTPQAVVEYLRE